MSDEVFRIIKGQIEEMQLVPGDRLPSESYLAEQFGVSRITIRAALQKLEALDLVETKGGGGTYVKKFSFSDILDSISSLMAKSVSYEDLSAFRRAIEPASIETLRGKNITSQDIKKLEKIYAAMVKDAEREDKVNFAKDDFEFHMQICRMSGNNMFIFSYELAQSVMVEYFQHHYTVRPTTAQLSLSAEQYYTNALRYHAEIISAFKENDIDRCLAIENSLM